MKRSKFNLSHYKLLTMDMGFLIPITWFEALPGDSIRMSTSALVRVSPLLSPVMHPVRVRIHHWFVPYRLIWDDFADFITGGEDGLDDTEPPYVSMSSNAEGTIYDYLGIPAETFAGSLQYSALPLRAYNLIFNEHYRDQDLITAVDISKGNGSDTTTYAGLLRAAWPKDYITTARPWESKGDTVTIPLGDAADVVSAGDGIPSFYAGGGSVRAMYGSSGNNVMLYNAAADASGATTWQDPKLEADLSTATGVAINDLRRALAMQRAQEARAQYGSRYVEYLRYLGVRSSDARLQTLSILVVVVKLYNFLRCYKQRKERTR